MKKFVYLITDRSRSVLQAGLSSDLLKSMSFHRSMPNLAFDAPMQLNRLVYFEEFSSEHTATLRFRQLNSFTRTQKEKLVRSVNPDWLDLTTGLDCERMLTAGFQFPMNQFQLS